LANNKIVQNSKHRDSIVDITGDAYGIALEDAMSADWAKTWGKSHISKFTSTNDEANKVFKEYLKYAGLDE
jgi:hypothetical protein